MWWVTASAALSFPFYFGSFPTRGHETVKQNNLAKARWPIASTVVGVWRTVWLG